MAEFFDACFSGQTLPATLLMGLVLLYWAFVVLGTLDFDFFDFDLDVDAEVESGSVVGLGFVSLRFLNLGEVPLMIWGSVFAASWWGVSLAFGTGWIPEPVDVLWLAIARNVGFAILATKLLTHPLRGKFEPIEPTAAEDLIGKECVISTSQATPEFGQAHYRTEGAPLVLHVRSLNGTLAKGDTAEIVGFDAEKHVYHVKRAETANDANQRESQSR